ncbi:MAG TPA: HEAT repeat domain-containing protein, partial [Tepidisphaeraceae bacterium]|nr:HEAT repeat domain-containing protein [Tepidisphaeraceae bacterium]
MNSRIGVVGLLGLALLGGCECVTHNIDDQPAIVREHFLGRRYVLDSDVTFVRAVPILFGSTWHWGSRSVSLSRGDRLEMVHVESIYAIDAWEDVAYPAEAVVVTGLRKGGRISLGNFDFNSRDAHFDPLMLSDTSPASTVWSIYPLPEHAPSWLDTNSVPPRAYPVPFGVLQAALHDPDWAIRYYALAGLAARGVSDDATLRFFVAALQDEVSDVRLLAIKTLKERGVKSNVVLRALVRRLSDPLVLDGEADHLADAIAARGPEGMSGAAALLDSANQKIADRGAAVLQDCGRAARPYVSKLAQLARSDPRWMTVDFDGSPMYWAVYK